MGAWGYGFLDNDPALDIQHLWDQMIEDSEYTHHDITQKCFNRWADAIRYGDTITNMEIIALVVLHLNNELQPDKKLVAAAIDAINRELVPEELSSWKEPEKRKHALMQLLKELGGKVKTPRKPITFHDPVLYYKNSKHARTELLKIVDDAKGLPWLTYRVVTEMKRGKRVKIPPFLQTLDRYMKHRLWEKDTNIYFQATAERLMMLATCLGISLKMSRDELAELFDRCAIYTQPTGATKK